MNVYFCPLNSNLNSKRMDSMQIIKMKVGDTLELKKPHPCGEKRFTVMRVGSEIRIVCAGCGRDMVLDRIKLEKAVRKVYPAPEGTSHGAES